MDYGRQWVEEIRDYREVSQVLRFVTRVGLLCGRGRGFTLSYRDINIQANRIRLWQLNSCSYLSSSSSSIYRVKHSVVPLLGGRTRGMGMKRQLRAKEKQKLGARD